MRGLRRLASGWWWMAGRRPVRGGVEVVVVLQFDPGDVMPVHGVKVLRLTPSEAAEMAETLRVCAAGSEDCSHG